MTVEMSTHLKRAIGLLAEGSSPNAPRGIGLTPDEARDLLSALPADLVAAATVEMPKEPGLYVGPRGTDDTVWQKGSVGDMFVAGNPNIKATPADGPFRRLVAEVDGPTHVFTGLELHDAWLARRGDGAGWPVHIADYVNAHIKGN